MRNSLNNASGILHRSSANKSSEIKFLDTGSIENSILGINTDNDNRFKIHHKAVNLQSTPEHKIADHSLNKIKLNFKDT